MFHLGVTHWPCQESRDKTAVSALAGRTFPANGGASQCGRGRRSRRANGLIHPHINRRHMTKGQRAMAVAMIYPEGDERGRGKKGNSAKLVEITNFSRSLLDHARVVLQWAPELAKPVLGGAQSHVRASS